MRRRSIARRGLVALLLAAGGCASAAPAGELWIPEGSTPAIRALPAASLWLPRGGPVTGRVDPGEMGGADGLWVPRAVAPAPGERGPIEVEHDHQRRAR